MSEGRSPGTLDGASAPRALALTVRFLLELALLAGVAALAWNLASGGWRWPAAIPAVIVVGTLWGLLLSPKARFPLPTAGAIVLEAVLFLGTAAGLVATTRLGVIAVIGGALWIADRLALALLPR